MKIPSTKFELSSRRDFIYTSALALSSLVAGVKAAELVPETKPIIAFSKPFQHLGPAAAAVVQPYYGKILTTTIPVDNTAQQAMSLFVNYRVAAIEGLSLGLGTNYQSKRAITDSANQLMFGYANGRILSQLNVNYRFNKHIKYSMNIDNLLNQKYIYSIRSENVIIKGAPIGVKTSVSYTF